jgi:hydroxymethylbilane synthase
LTQDRLIKIGTRKSELAIWQANHLASQLQKLGFHTKVIVIEGSSQDSTQTFTSEVEKMILEGQVDIGVHSLKDLSTIQHPNLVLAALSERANPADVLILHPRFYDENALFKISSQAKVGTSSERRRVQFNSFRSDVTVVPIRGNITDRIDRVRNEKVDAIIIAKAGIDRLQLNLDQLKVINFHPKEFIPAPGQGVLAYQVLAGNVQLRKILMKIHNYDVAQCTNIERTIFDKLAGVCKSPIGVYCEKDLRGTYQCFLSAEKNGNLVKIKYAQSTAFGLSDSILNEFQNII